MTPTAGPGSLEPMLLTRHVDLIGGFLDGEKRVVSVPMSTVLHERYVDHDDTWWAQRYVLILGVESSCYAAMGEPVRV
jgi:hypothetical protein